MPEDRFKDVLTPPPVIQSDAQVPPPDAPTVIVTRPVTSTSIFQPPTQTVGNYQLGQLLGSGGMGEVYEAMQAHPRRRVALKLVKPDSLTPHAIGLFEAEAEKLGRLQHAGIAQIFEAGYADFRSGRQPYFAMEFISGRPLDTYARERRLSVRQRLTLIARIADAVHHAHEQGVIHCDLKPANIIVDDHGQPKVLDFGVAVMKGDPTGAIGGTVAFMSPEQAQKGHLDPRTDVYSLAVLTYVLLTGRMPYLVRAGSDVVRAICEQPPQPILSVRGTLRGDLETVLFKGLAKDRSDRYQSARDLGADINRVVTGSSLKARTESVWTSVRQWVTHEDRVRQAGLTGILLVLGLCAFNFVAIAFIVTGALGLTTRWPINGIRVAAHLLGANLALTVMGFVSWFAMKGRFAFIWLGAIGALLLLAFTLSVLTVFPYDVGGALPSREGQHLLYSLLTPLAFIAATLYVLALLTAYRIRQLDGVPPHESEHGKR